MMALAGCGVDGVREGKEGALALSFNGIVCPREPDTRLRFSTSVGVRLSRGERGMVVCQEPVSACPLSKASSRLDSVIKPGSDALPNE